MPAPQPPVAELSDDDVVRLFTTVTVGFAGGLVLILGIGVLFLVPGAPLSTTGAAVGVGLALVSWFGSRWVTGWGASNAARSARRRSRASTGDQAAPAGGRSDGANGVARTIAFMGIGFAEGPGLVGLAIGLQLHDIGPFAIALPVAVAAVVLNASGPGAMRRHLQRVRSGRTD
ncbi:MAG: hypothetical protein BGO38_03770 [Cellulomonas sp. 73-145]|uniref:hypothetical protein n=1 Tax=Cellulomonas sp. 73-145 TaxID=1895739 RepID=UPI000928CD5C|nr:hypothetical protein [Cellulomonas sp. 73-145]MBN9325498.1 hypothetical protein [Cellulomonas sp.]OJV57040.1 MAG: hypothetical protein BGO38_03770 [Cellulomonas sp. 73-145]